MLFVMDTDHLSLLQRKQQPEYDRLSNRLDQIADDFLCTTVISFQEQVLGWAAYLNRARKPADIVRAYHELFLIEQYYRDFTILPFDASSQALFESLRRLRVRISDSGSSHRLNRTSSRRHAPQPQFT
jgi:tRNA(fMet)-specific endonuclease VapC